MSSSYSDGRLMPLPGSSCRKKNLSLSHTQIETHDLSNVGMEVIGIASLIALFSTELVVAREVSSTGEQSGVTSLMGLRPSPNPPPACDFCLFLLISATTAPVIVTDLLPIHEQIKTLGFHFLLEIFYLRNIGITEW